MATFGAIAIPLFTIEHTPDYFERGWIPPQLFQAVMLCIVWPSWGFLNYREIKKAYKETMKTTNSGQERMKGQKNKKHDYYITFLKYAREKMEVGEGTVDYTDFFQHVHSIHGDVSEQAFKRTFLQAVVTTIYQGMEARDEDIENGIPMVLALEAYFHLLEHQELQEARMASKKAITMATLAMVISAAWLSPQSLSRRIGYDPLRRRHLNLDNTDLYHFRHQARHRKLGHLMN